MGDTQAPATARPLKWRKPTDHPSDHEDAAFVADGIGGRYAVMRDGLLWFAHDEFVWEQFQSIDAAKQAAEADWQKRFAALIVEAVNSFDELRALLKEARDQLWPASPRAGDTVKRIDAALGKEDCK